MSALSEIVATLTEADERCSRILRWDADGCMVVESDDEVLGDELNGIASHISYALVLAKRVSDGRSMPCP